MRKKRWHGVAFALTFAAILHTVPEKAFGQESARAYTPASLRGDYAVVATYGANVARALGTQTMDGHGSLRGVAFVNQPGPDDSRQLSRLSFRGISSLRTDGTGIFFLEVKLPNGKTAEVQEDFVITKTRVIDGVLTATEIVDEQREPSAAIDGNVFVTHTYTRRDR
ncbi:MAG: hypothetical protein ACR2JE_15090 [Acidobacteriaceae bacterium]